MPRTKALPDVIVPCGGCTKPLIRPAWRMKKVGKAFCSRECLRTLDRKGGRKGRPHVQIPCGNCGLPLDRPAWYMKTGVHKNTYCNRECQGAHQGRKTSKRMLRLHRLGKIRPRGRRRTQKTCKQCSQEYEIILSWAPTSSYCSRDCHNAAKRMIRGPAHPLYRLVTLVCTWCRSDYLCKPAVVPRSRFCSKSCHGSWVVRNTHSPTSIETTVSQWLTDWRIKFEQQARIGRYLCDFLIPASRQVIECDGTYWHGIPKVRARDERKDINLIQLGYSVTRLPEANIRDGTAKQTLAHLLG